MIERPLIACLWIACALAACAAPARPKDGSEQRIAKASTDSERAPQKALSEIADISSQRARVEFAVETTLGANCAPALPSPYGHRGYCRGAAPQHVRTFFDRLAPSLASNEQEHASAALAGPVFYKAISGLGERADFIVEWPMPNGRTALVRSLESADGRITTFVTTLGCAKDACAVGTHLRAYRLSLDGALEEATQDVFPEKPTLSGRERYDRLGVGEVDLDTTRLHLAATLRWTAEADPDALIPMADPRAFAGGWEAHFGFLVWTGQRYERRDTVARALWPCPPYRELNGETKACPPSDRRLQDRFVTD